jgi:hypothetical protein
MPDTGAPWNIPYVDPTDLVRDYPQASEDLADAIALGLSAAGNPGIGSNVVQTIKNDTFTTSSGTFTDLTGLTVTITPTSNTSKIYVVAVIAGSFNGNNVLHNLVRDSTTLAQPSGGTSPSMMHIGGSATDIQNAQVVLSVLDSPAKDTATVYKVQVRTSAGSTFINRSNADAQVTSVSSITAIEVAP